MTKPKVKLEKLLHEKKKSAFEHSQQQSKSKVTGKQTVPHAQNRRGRPLSK
ncbi:hypothetical protein [Enterococcus sp. DIV0756]|uniref:hypothetical protein n=1 Tax=Enterococcus sp. DIV0756 TaxID=2774636 RepID=UPI003F68874C